MWAKVRELTNKQTGVHIAAGVTADSLNTHYTSISCDASYIMPETKYTAGCFSEWPAESVVYNALSALKPTTEGPDELPY